MRSRHLFDRLTFSSSLLASVPWHWSFLTEDLQLHGPRPLCFEEHLQSVDGETLKRTCVDFTLLGNFQIEPKPSGAQILVLHLDVDEHVGLVAVLHADARLLYLGL